MNLIRFGSLILLALSVLACDRPKETPPQPAAPAASPAPSLAPTTTPALPASAAAPITVMKQTELETVSVSTEPYCRKAAGPGGTDAAARPNHAWLAETTVQQKLGVLDAELKPYASSLIGITFEDEPKTAIVVLYPNFTAYEELQTRLAPLVKPLAVALRPGCHSAEQLAEAQTVLQGRAWHPKASTTPVGWHLDAASSAYSVVVEDSEPDVAEALRQKLGDRVQVTLGKPRRHALGATGSGKL